MKKIRKEDLELAQLKRFLANSQLEISVSSVERGQDPPDFVISLNGKSVSVELTRLFDHRIKQLEEFRNTIIKGALALFQAKYTAELYCLITFLNIKLDGGQAMLQKFTQQLFSEIENIYLTYKNEEFNVEVSRTELQSQFLDTLRVRNTMGTSHWQHFSAYKVDWIDLERLQSIISNKAKNIKKYSGTFEENWLLLISNIGTKSSSNRFDFLDFAGIETNFDKVYVYKYIEDEIYVIK